MKKRTIYVLLAVFAGLISIVCFAINRSYYPMGGEVTVISKQANNNKYYITVEQGAPGNAGWGQFELECTPEQYQAVDVGDVIECDRTQSVVTHKGKIHKIHASIVEKDPASVESNSTPVALNITDLISVFDTLDLTEATLINHTGTEATYPAKAAIRAESYIEELKSFIWEEYTPPVEWDRKDGFFCQLITNDVSITAFQSGYSDSRPLHLVTDEGEGWFVLPYIQSEPGKAAKQVGWMIYDTFFSWCLEAEAAALYSTGGEPLTAEELSYFGEYTSSHRSIYDEEDGSYTVGTTEISCFFTSQYSDPRDINAGEFLAYCPDEDVLTKEDKDEFRLVQEKLDWRVGADNHLATFDEFPVPCHRIPRTFLNGILMKYAGITVEDMNTNWMEEAFYIPQTDCFYTFTSDFGPGEFRPCYGEKKGDTLTLWEELNAYDGRSYALTLQKSGDDWHILSRQPAIYHFTAEVVKYGNDALYVKVVDAGDSTLSIGDELYVSVRDGYDNYPVGCSVEVAYSGNVIVYDDGSCGPDKTISVYTVQS